MNIKKIKKEFDAIYGPLKGGFFSLPKLSTPLYRRKARFAAVFRLQTSRLSRYLARFTRVRWRGGGGGRDKGLEVRGYEAMGPQ